MAHQQALKNKVAAEQQASFTAVAAIYPRFFKNPTIIGIAEIINELPDEAAEKDNFIDEFDNIFDGEKDCAVLAICLFCVHEALAMGSVKTLLEDMDTTLEKFQETTDLNVPAHCGSNHPVYNHMFGLYAVCTIENNVIQLGQLSAVFTSVNADDPVLAAFDNWINKPWTQMRANNPIFHDIIDRTVRYFLTSTAAPQCHLLLQIILAVEKWKTHLQVRDFVSNYEVRLGEHPCDYDVVDHAGYINVPSENNDNGNGRAPATPATGIQGGVQAGGPFGGGRIDTPMQPTAARNTQATPQHLNGGNSPQTPTRRGKSKDPIRDDPFRSPGQNGNNSNSPLRFQAKAGIKRPFQRVQQYEEASQQYRQKQNGVQQPEQKQRYNEPPAQPEVPQRSEDLDWEQYINLDQNGSPQSPPEPAPAPDNGMNGFGNGSLENFHFEPNANFLNDNQPQQTTPHPAINDGGFGNNMNHFFGRLNGNVNFSNTNQLQPNGTNFGGGQTNGAFFPNQPQHGGFDFANFNMPASNPAAQSGAMSGQGYTGFDTNGQMDEDEDAEGEVDDEYINFQDDDPKDGDFIG